ncbi:MAG: hypothetical protein DCC63_14755 [Nitrospira sp.]|nr:MAG: hypothetical protein DCC63_14755 [Nitrospira sp.]
MDRAILIMMVVLALIVAILLAGEPGIPTDHDAQPTAGVMATDPIVPGCPGCSRPLVEVFHGYAPFSVRDPRYSFEGCTGNPVIRFRCLHCQRAFDDYLNDVPERHQGRVQRRA